VRFDPSREWRMMGFRFAGLRRAVLRREVFRGFPVFFMDECYRLPRGG
jgi:hypothetical protein